MLTLKHVKMELEDNVNIEKKISLRLNELKNEFGKLVSMQVIKNSRFPYSKSHGSSTIFRIAVEFYATFSK